jgi:hypothetical protein
MAKVTLCSMNVGRVARRSRQRGDDRDVMRSDRSGSQAMLCRSIVNRRLSTDWSASVLAIVGFLQDMSGESFAAACHFLRVLAPKRTGPLPAGRPSRDPSCGLHRICARPRRPSSPLLPNLVFSTHRSGFRYHTSGFRYTQWLRPS